MQRAEQGKIPFTIRLRNWLNDKGYREKLYPIILIAAAYVLALAGGAAIGATSFGFLIVGGLVAGIAGAVISLRPHIGLYILIFFIFAYLSDVLETAFGIPDSNKALVALIAVGTVSSIVIHDKPLIFRTSEILVMAYGLCVILSLFVNEEQTQTLPPIPLDIDPDTGKILSEESPDTLELIIDWFKDFAILMIVVQLSTTEAIWKRTHWVLISAAGFLAIFSVYQTLTQNYTNDFYGLAQAPVHQITNEQDSVRITGPLIDPNYYAMIHVMALPTAIYMVLGAKRTWVKGLALIITLLILATILFTYSRGAFLALVVLGGLIIYDLRLNPYKIVVIGLALGIILIPVLPRGFTHRLETLVEFIPGAPKEDSSQTEASFRGRTSEALVGIEMFSDHPIFGVGRRNYARNYLKYSPSIGLDPRAEAREAHNLYLEVASEQGTVGLIVFAAMVGVVFRQLFEAKRLLRIVGDEHLIPGVSGIQFGLIGYLICSIFLHLNYERYFWLIVALALGCSVMAQEKFRQFENQRRQALIEYEEIDYSI